jgi:PTH1 family peptidyl-tRNA hydrolase
MQVVYNNSMKLFVGLGNPGKEYQENRHNIGFMFVEYLVKKLSPETSFTMNTRFAARIAEFNHNDDKWIVAEPQAYMNRSGEASSKLAVFYKVPKTDFFVAHDDLDIPFGKFKIQNGTGPKLHGGLSSIEQLFGTTDFWRIRIGVESRTPDQNIPGEAYVLQNFSSDEKTQLSPLFDKILNQLLLQKVI